MLIQGLMAVSNEEKRFTETKLFHYTIYCQYLKNIPKLSNRFHVYRPKRTYMNNTLQPCKTHYGAHAFSKEFIHCSIATNITECCAVDIHFYHTHTYYG